MHSIRDILGPAKTEELLDQLHCWTSSVKTLGLVGFKLLLQQPPHPYDIRVSNPHRTRSQKELQPWDSFFSNFKPPKVGPPVTPHAVRSTA